MASADKKNKKAKLERVALRVPPALKQEYERAASLQCQTFSGWAKTVLAEATDRQIREHQFLEMAIQDRLTFAQAIIAPPKPTEVAVDAAKRYKQMLLRFATEIADE